MNEHYETLKTLSMSAEEKVEIDPDVLRWAISRIERLSKELKTKNDELETWFWDRSEGCGGEDKG